jgi:hypothetical protein
MSEPTACCLCGLPYERLGNSPSPLARDGRCCDACDQVVTEARISWPAFMDEVERVEDAMLRMPSLLRQTAIAAICASRGPVLWAQRQHERAQLMAMIERDDV